jgi:hypothetical protein
MKEFDSKKLAIIKYHFFILFFEPPCFIDFQASPESTTTLNQFFCKYFFASDTLRLNRFRNLDNLKIIITEL